MASELLAKVFQPCFRNFCRQEDHIRDDHRCKAQTKYTGRMIAKERESRLREATIRQGVESINFLKGNTAVIKGKYAIDGVAVALGVKKSFEGPFILRVRKQNGEWSILSAQLLKS